MCDDAYVFWRACVGLVRTVYIRCCKVYLAGESPNVRSYSLYVYGSGPPERSG